MLLESNNQVQGVRKVFPGQLATFNGFISYRHTQCSKWLEAVEKELKHDFLASSTFFKFSFVLVLQG